MKAIYKRELRSYFTNIMGWLFIALITVVFGICVRAKNYVGQYPYVEFNFYTTAMLITLILGIAVLTMRCVAEERRQKTDQLLYSLPVSTTQVILGKYFALMTVMGLACVLMIPYPFILSMYAQEAGAVNIMSALSGIVGFVFLGATLMAIGVFTSAVTDNQVVSAVLSFAIMIGFLLTSTLAGYIPATAFASLCALEAFLVIFAIVMGLMTHNYWFGLIVGVVTCAGTMGLYTIKQTWFEGLFPKILRAISMFDRYNSFVYRTFDISAIIFDISVAALFLFFAVQAMEKRRWS